MDDKLISSVRSPETIKFKVQIEIQEKKEGCVKTL